MPARVTRRSPLLWKRSIRVKVLVGLGLLLLLVVTLSSSGLYGTYSYRGLVKSLTWRANELPSAAELSRQVGECRITLGKLRVLHARPAWPNTDSNLTPTQVRLLHETLRGDISDVQRTLARYRAHLERQIRD